MGVMDDYIKAHPASEPEPVALQRTYTLDEKTVALIMLARCYGRATAAHKALKEERGLEIPVATLQDWKNGEDYETLKRGYAHLLEEELVREARENAYAASGVERLGLERIELLLATGNIRASDVAAMVNAATSAKTKNIDKLMTLTGRPQVITESRDFSNIVEALLQKRVLTLDQGPADDIADAEVVP